MRNQYKTIALVSAIPIFVAVAAVSFLSFGCERDKELAKEKDPKPEQPAITKNIWDPDLVAFENKARQAQQEKIAQVEKTYLQTPFDAIGFRTSKDTFLARFADAGSSAFSPDGRYLAISSSGSATVWDLQDCSVVQQFATEKLGMTTLFSTDNKYLAVFDRAGKIFLWDLKKKEKSDLPNRMDHTLGIQFSPDGTQIIAAEVVPAKDYQLKLVVRHWDLATNRQLSETALLQAHMMPIFVVFSPDGTLVAGPMNQTSPWNFFPLKLPVWRTKDGALIARQEFAKLHGGLVELAFSSGATCLAMSAATRQEKDGEINGSEWMYQEWNLQTENVQEIAVVKGTYPAGFVYSPGDEQIFFGNQNLSVWNRAQKRLIYQSGDKMRFGPPGAVSPGGIFLCCRGSIWRIDELLKGSKEVKN